MAYSHLSLFSGIGGLDVGLKQCGVRAVGYVERDSYAAAVLMARMESEELDRAPVWVGDIADLDVSVFEGVDGVAGGFPCQDLSVAGKRAGIGGERSGLWSEFARIIGDVRPRWVFIENVTGLLATGAMRRVLGDLSALGFDAEWESVRASDVGAPHRRERVFILGYSQRALRETAGRRPIFDAGGEPGAGCRDVAHSNATVRDESRRGNGSSGSGKAESLHAGGELAHTRSQRSQGIFDGRTEEGSTGRSGGADIPKFPPAPNDAESWRRVLERRPDLAPAVANTADLLGWREQGSGADPSGSPCSPGASNQDGTEQRTEQQDETQPAVRRVADGTSARMDRLRCLGNAVVPQQAAVAFEELWRRI